MDDLLPRFKQIQQHCPDAERQWQRLLSEFNTAIQSPMALMELSRMLQEDALEALLRRKVQPKS